MHAMCFCQHAATSKLNISAYLYLTMSHQLMFSRYMALDAKALNAGVATWAWHLELVGAAPFIILLLVSQKVFEIVEFR